MRVEGKSSCIKSGAVVGWLAMFQKECSVLRCALNVTAAIGAESGDVVLATGDA